MTIQMSADNRGSRWFWENKHDYLNAKELWQHWMDTAGRGSNLIINVPPSIYGGVPPKYAAEAAKLGQALRASFATPVVAVTNVSLSCSNSSSSGSDGEASSVNLTLPNATQQPWNAFVTREDLGNSGQLIWSYTIERLDDATGEWVALSSVHGGSVGNRIVDVASAAEVAATTTVRFRCTDGDPDRPAMLSSFGAYLVTPP